MKVITSEKLRLDFMTELTSLLRKFQAEISIEDIGRDHYMAYNILSVELKSVWTKDKDGYPEKLVSPGTTINLSTYIDEDTDINL